MGGRSSLGFPAAVISGDMASAAALFGGGRTLSHAQMRLAKRIANDDRAIEWLISKAPALGTPKQLFLSLGGLATVEGLKPSTPAALRELLPAKDDGFERLMQMDGQRERAAPPRDPATGRFTSPLELLRK